MVRINDSSDSETSVERQLTEGFKIRSTGRQIKEAAEEIGRSRGEVQQPEG